MTASDFISAWIADETVASLLQLAFCMLVGFVLFAKVWRPLIFSKKAVLLVEASIAAVEDDCAAIVSQIEYHMELVALMGVLDARRD